GFGRPGGMQGAGGPFGGAGAAVPPALVPTSSSAPSVNVVDFARQLQQKEGEVSKGRGAFEDRRFADLPAPASKGGDQGDGKDQPAKVLQEAKEKKKAYDEAREALGRKQNLDVQAGKLGVDLSVQMNNLRNQTRLEYTAQRNVGGRNVMEIGGVWIDDGFDAKMPVVTVKAQSDAYFRILERHAKVKEVFQLGNHLVWVTPNGTALVIDTNDGKDKLSDEEIDKLFVAKK